MTTEVIQAAPAEFDLPQMCDGRQWEGEYGYCRNKAEYRCQISCCGGTIWWCETCLFAFFEYCEYINSDGWDHYGICVICNSRSVIIKEHIKVVGRIT